MSFPPSDPHEPFPFPVVLSRPLRELSTFKIGGPARYFTEVTSIAQLRQVLQFCQRNGLRYLVVGKGSNSLFDDRGFDGLVVGMRISHCDFREPNLFHVGAGYSFSRLGAQTARQGWKGLEFASGIPGAVGGAVFMNAGANGGDAAGVLASVDYMDPEGRLETFARETLQFSYRTSPFQQMAGAVVAATFVLSRDSGARERQVAIVDYRKRTQPYGEPSAGCVFRNPGDDCRSAGALIEQAGLKGHQLGGAQVSTLHANFLVNSGTATAGDVLSLMDVVKNRVHEQFAVELESEIRYIPWG
jgi:UDP-N-acetylmuramate dehydrogenase